MSRRTFAIWYVIFCEDHHVTHTWKTKSAARRCLRDLRKDFPQYDWSMRRLVETLKPRKRRKARGAA